MAAIISLDKVVKNILMKRGYSPHWYIQFLVYSKDALREIAFDCPIIPSRYKCLAVDQTTHFAELPNDFVDKIRVSARVGQYVLPLVEDDSLQTIPNYDAEFNVVDYNEGVQVPDEDTQGPYYYGLGGYITPYWFLNNINSWGENIGRLFGGVQGYNDTYKIDRANNRIKVNENLYIQEIVLEYISNGMDADSATHIDAYAQMAIEKFCIWQHKEHNRSYGIGETATAEADFRNELRILRGRLNPLTLDQLNRIISKSRAAVKY